MSAVSNAPVRTTPVELVVEFRAGSLAAAVGKPPSLTPKGQLDMVVWKRIVADIVACNPETPVRGVFFGGANQIIGYRLYYILRYAKKAGVRHLTLHSDGGFWIDEATDWLVDSGVDRVIIVTGREQVLAARVRELEAKAGAGGRPLVEIYSAAQNGHWSLRLAPGVRMIDWRGEPVN